MAKLSVALAKDSCPAWIRTMIAGSKVLRPTIRRPGKLGYNYHNYTIF